MYSVNFLDKPFVYSAEEDSWGHYTSRGVTPKRIEEGLRTYVEPEDPQLQSIESRSEAEASGSLTASLRDTENDVTATVYLRRRIMRPGDNADLVFILNLSTATLRISFVHYECLFPALQKDCRSGQPPNDELIKSVSSSHSDHVGLESKIGKLQIEKACESRGDGCQITGDSIVTCTTVKESVYRVPMHGRLCISMQAPDECPLSLVVPNLVCSRWFLRIQLVDANGSKSECEIPIKMIR